MASLINKTSRILSIALVCIGGILFLFTAYSGYHTWMQSFFNDQGMSIETIIAAVETIILLPGLALVMTAFYFFVLLKEPIYNLLGFFVTSTTVFFHFLVTVPAVHSEVVIAFLMSCTELAVVLTGIWLFNKFIVQSES
ncbi:hypothetical protein [Neptuniibacter sp.]|uniref:hypothetical protein n=1 Tax=Neptuniibacter sp. TaxID=1962643 RepID=UPI003B592F83